MTIPYTPCVPDPPGTERLSVALLRLVRGPARGGFFSWSLSRLYLQYKRPDSGPEPQVVIVDDEEGNGIFAYHVIHETSVWLHMHSGSGSSQRERRRADDFVVKRHRSNGEEYIVDRATGKITYAACCITCHGTTATTTATSNINGTRFRAILFSL